MSKIREKIMKTNFAKKLKKLLILSACVLLLGGGISALSLSTQIGEVISQAQSWEKTDSELHRDAYHWLNEEYSFENWKWNRFEKRDIHENFQLTEPILTAKIAIGITSTMFILLAVAFWVLISMWLYQAAVRADMNGSLWLLMGLGGNIFAALLFILVRSFIRKKCPSCGHYQSTDMNFCTQCGTLIRKKCPSCGVDCGSDEVFCHACGQKMEKEEQQAGNC